MQKPVFGLVYSRKKLTSNSCVNIQFLLLFCSYFLKLLLDKKYALPYRVLDAVLSHFVRFIEDDRDLPVIWHQSLLTFVQR